MPLITKEGVRGDSRLKIGYLQSIDFQHHRFLLYGRDALYRIEQIEKAKTVEHITGLKKLRGYISHYRVYVKTAQQSFRIGAMIRGWCAFCLVPLSTKNSREQNMADLPPILYFLCS